MNLTIFSLYCIQMHIAADLIQFLDERHFAIFVHMICICMLIYENPLKYETMFACTYIIVF